MPLRSTAELLERAARTGTAVGAFNVITVEHAEAVVAGAEAAGGAVILQISQNAVRFHGGNLRPIALAAGEVASAARIDASLHLDHVDDAGLLHAAADAGFSSVMFDASTLEYEANVATTRAAVEWGHANGLYVEAELGKVGGKDGAHAPGVRTDPGEATEFVAATGVDALAVAVGSSHAMTSRTAALDHDLIAQLQAVVPVPLVLHGSSGVADDDLRAAVRAGMVKINIGTALNIAFSGAVREFLATDDRTVDPRKYLAPARTRMSDVVAHLVELLALTTSPNRQ